MSTKKKRKKSSFILILMLCFLLSLSNINIVNAEALPEASVTIADCVMSYMASAGTFICNTNWINTLYSSLGETFGTVDSFINNGMLTTDASGNIIATQALEDAISQTSAYQSLNLDTLFGVSEIEAQLGGGVVASGAGTLAGALGGVASTGVLPLAVGVTGAYWGGISIGNLIAHSVGLYGKPVLYDYPVDEAYRAALNSIQIGNVVTTASRIYREGQDPYITLLTGPGYGFSYIDGSHAYIVIKSSPTGAASRGVYWTGRLSSGMNKTENVNLTASVSTEQYDYSVNAANNFQSKAEYDAYMEQWSNNQVTPEKYPAYSKDIITPTGNAKGQVDNGEIKIPSFTPEVNPTGQSIVPGGASRLDWLRWANGAKGNNNLNDPDSNADIFEEILQAIRNNNPSPGVNPDPDPNPNPNPTPTPTPVPKPDYDPDNPDQPEYDPKETEGPDDVTNGDPWTTPDLLDRFPFCLPRDVFRCFEKLNVNERMAPSISWHFVTPLGIHFDFDLDLDDYEGVATILRTLELIAFIIGLALATRNLIGR